MEDHSVFVPNVHFEKIPIKNLVSNQKYQRNLSKAHIANAAANFDPYQINPVKVSRRDGVNYVFNGQHTIEIVALVSGSRDTPVSSRCMPPAESHPNCLCAYKSQASASDKYRRRSPCRLLRPAAGPTQFPSHR